MQNLLEASDAVRRQKVSPVELTDECLRRIERLNPRVNAFITVTEELARNQARKAEKEILSGDWRGPLHGIPIGLKDLIDTAGVRTTAASRMHASRIPGGNARVWELLERSGAVLLGKQNLHEFAYGGSSMVSAYGAVHNPWDAGAIAGGSSGGSAAAVALGMGYAAIGTDTAGSIREPAALCGVVGMKPTYARVSAAGIIPLSRSLDHVGPITRSAADAAVVLDAISEEGPAALRGQENQGGSLLDATQRSPQNLRVGIPRDYFFTSLDEEVDSAFRKALELIQALVAEVRDIILHPDPDTALQGAEMYELHRDSLERSAHLYQPQTLQRLRAVSQISEERRAAGRQALEAARREICSAFDQLDLLVTPTTVRPAPMIADLEAQPEQLRPMEIVLLRNTRPFNVWGLPAISVPCGFTRAGLPIGLQIAGAPWQDGLVLRLAHAYEQATEWHRREPVL